MLSDLQSQATYEPGDRVIARVCINLTAEQRHAIMRAVREHAGADVDVLILNCAKLWLFKQRPGKPDEVLCGPAHYGRMQEGTANLHCSKVTFDKGESLLLSVPASVGADAELQIKMMVAAVRKWAGPDVEVVVMPRVIGSRKIV